MCGIAGILTNGRADLPKSLSVMKSALAHRGPDDAGTAEIELPFGWRLGLAHTRLSILDLSAAGHQPMVDVRTSSWIAFNGEIYNHAKVRATLGELSFRSTGDTETLLLGWSERGPAILDEMRGMYAFALWDGRRKRFWLVRDRLGIKPLYVAKADEHTWIFASEIRALLATDLIRRRVSRLGLESYLSLGSIAAPWTIVDSVESLLPAERWCFDFSTDADPKPKKSIYWQANFAKNNGKVLRRQEALEMVRPVLAEATALRMVSDVPVGVFLSGGIDSSAVVSSLVSQGYDLHTFSATFDEKNFDESMHSRKVAVDFGTTHTELKLRPSEMVERLGAAIAAYDQPSIDGINTYFISEVTRAAGVKVALSGLGGDELFAGYPYFRLMGQLANPIRRAGIQLAQLAGGLVRRSDVRLKKLGGVLRATNRLDQYGNCRLVMPLELRDRLLHGSPQSVAMPLESGFAESLLNGVDSLDPINAHSYLELSLYLANMLLRDTDQMSMAHALEVREPLLDHVLVETLGKIPGALKLEPGSVTHTKGLLADALERPLPESVVARRKMGFVFPWERWLRADLAAAVDANLCDVDRVESLGLDPAAVATVWRDYRAGRPNVRYTDILCLHHLLAWSRRNEVVG